MKKSLEITKSGSIMLEIIVKISYGKTHLKEKVTQFSGSKSIFKVLKGVFTENGTKQRKKNAYQMALVFMSVQTIQIKGNKFFTAGA